MFRKTSLVLLILLAATIKVAAQANADNREINLLLSKLPQNVETKRYKGYVLPRSNATTSRSFYLPMRDGVKIAVTVVLPEGLQANEKIPAVMTMTRYWRGKQGEQANPFLPSHGYAQVLVDARGTGASYGCLLYTSPSPRDS